MVSHRLEKLGLTRRQIPEPIPSPRKRRTRD
jgi:hypothetical protein